MNTVSRWGTIWFVAVVVAIGAAPLVGLSWGWRFTPLLPVLLGLIVFALPLATPYTVEAFGIRGAMRVGRFLAVAMMAGGLAVYSLVGAG